MVWGKVDEKYPQWINEIELADAPYGIVTRESPLRVLVGVVTTTSLVGDG